MLKSTLLCICFLLAWSCTPENKQTETTVPQPILLELSDAHKHTAPYLFTGGKGEVFLSYISSSEGNHSLNYRQLEESHWSEAVTIASGEDWFVNWADYPQLTTFHNNQLLSFFLQKSGEGVYAYDIKMVQSPDGQAWNKPFTLHDDGLEAEHGFVSMLPYEDNAFVAWLDGRNTVTENADEHVHHGHGGGAMTLRAAILDTDGNKTKEWELDNRVCDCCQTSAAMTNNGPIVVYRDRSEEEIRNISIVRLVDGQWTSPRPVYPDNWQVPGCPVNGPRADGLDNTLGVAWFTAAQGRPEVKVAFSQNGGETFDNPLKINEGPTIGRVDFALLSNEKGVVTWMEGADIKLRAVDIEGNLGPTRVIASSSDKRSSGFPQMTKTKDKLIFAWTDTPDSLATIHTATLNIEDL